MYIYIYIYIYTYTYTYRAARGLRREHRVDAGHLHDLSAGVVHRVLSLPLHAAADLRDKVQADDGAEEQDEAPEADGDQDLEQDPAHLVLLHDLRKYILHRGQVHVDVLHVPEQPRRRAPAERGGVLQGSDPGAPRVVLDRRAEARPVRVGRARDVADEELQRVGVLRRHEACHHQVVAVQRPGQRRLADLEGAAALRGRLPVSSCCAMPLTHVAHAHAVVAPRRGPDHREGAARLVLPAPARVAVGRLAWARGVAGGQTVLAVAEAVAHPPGGEHGAAHRRAARRERHRPRRRAPGEAERARAYRRPADAYYYYYYYYFYFYYC